jgi:hypothetical protein
MWQQRVDTLLDYVAHGIEKLVDRRSDGDDHRSAGRYVFRPAGKEQPLIGQRLGEQRLGALSMNGTRPDFKVASVCSLEVVDVDCQSLRGKRQHQRNTDMAGAADHSQIGGLGGDCANGGGTVGNVQHLSPNVDCPGERSHEVGRKQSPQKP